MTEYLGKSLEQIRKEYDALREQDDPEPCFLDYASALDFVNCSKNRYSNVLPNESSRVHLDEIEGYGSDYINANHIDGEGPSQEKAYILTQAPLPATFGDFWRMIWEHNCPLIVMLTRLWERSAPKADVYWPQAGETLEFPYLSVSGTKTIALKYITIRHFTLTTSQCGQQLERPCIQIHYSEWPDFGVPQQNKYVLRLLELIDLYQAELGSSGISGPLAMHCSAGLGRTGTLAAIHISVQNFLHGLPVDIEKTVLIMRRQRSKVVQTQDQYEFVYRVVDDALASLKARSLNLRAALAAMSPASSDEQISDAESDSAETDVPRQPMQLQAGHALTSILPLALTTGSSLAVSQ